MNFHSSFFLVLGALSAASSVAIGAATAHMQNPAIAANLPLISMALQYQQFHALGLLFTGMLQQRQPSHWLLAAGGLMLLGTLLFSVNLYLRAFVDIQTFRALVPVGGGAFIAGWLALAIGVMRR